MRVCVFTLLMYIYTYTYTYRPSCVCVCVWLIIRKRLLLKCSIHVSDKEGTRTIRTSARHTYLYSIQYNNVYARRNSRIGKCAGGMGGGVKVVQRSRYGT